MAVNVHKKGVKIRQKSFLLQRVCYTTTISASMCAAAEGNEITVSLENAAGTKRDPCLF